MPVEIRAPGDQVGRSQHELPAIEILRAPHDPDGRRSSESDERSLDYSFGRGSSARSPACMPPSMTNSVPVQYELSSGARKSTRLVTSSGVPIRPAGRRL